MWHSALHAAGPPGAAPALFCSAPFVVCIEQMMRGLPWLHLVANPANAQHSLTQFGARKKGKKSVKYLLLWQLPQSLSLAFPWLL